ncbi:hypothetical protein BDBG_08652 [Blastomyces gilchristii SLH14081]|uniref:Uncharacterized protein n=1 Tax=Blastomyces gilchristii (strain SLH14081) TaxID=559298 RepID=A0A179V233_BLAGS|nr:uncharacterized protein BDBG_08652 [Blastomyces gilchristii SLH14081]OAT13457.1 hypothetical protein BDBG_08652 [Blastomyces gilchristii SLH14081]
MAENRSLRVRGGRGSAIENGRESERTRSRMKGLESVECNGIVYIIDRAQPATQSKSRTEEKSQVSKLTTNLNPQTSVKIRELRNDTDNKLDIMQAVEIPTFQNSYNLLSDDSD